MDGAFYLFGCDADWQAITDTWHESVREAKAQAEFEYDVSAEEWTEAKLNPPLQPTLGRRSAQRASLSRPPLNG